VNLQTVLRERADASLGDILLEVYDAAYCAGAGLVAPPPHDAAMASLLTTLEARHRVEILDMRDQKMLADELPGWLLRLKQQADVVEPPAIEGWPV